jgi:hypothetical protein
LQNLLQTGGFAVGCQRETALGDPDRPDAVLEVLGVPFAVILERVSVLVELPAVAFDDQVVLRKEGIGLPAADLDVDLGCRQPVLGGEGEEVVLEV